MAKSELGVSNNKLGLCPKTPNCVSSQTESKAHYIQPIAFMGTQEEAYSRITQIIESEKRTKLIILKKDYIRSEFTSALFRFVDDVEFYFPETQAGKTVIHVRSASRVGYSDFGANRKRIERIRSKF